MSREMIFSENEYDRMNYLMTAIMDAGELLAMHGAEVSRVEDTITRLHGVRLCSGRCIYHYLQYHCHSHAFRWKDHDPDKAHPDENHRS